MQSILRTLSSLVLLIPVITFSQSDNCNTPTNLPVTANCSSPLAGTSAGATQSLTGCAGTADDDVWYSFTATSASHQITVDGSATYDAVVEVFSGTCAGLTTLSCTDVGVDGDVETVNLAGLSIGTVYLVRVYDYYTGSGSNTFTICCTVGASAPANNNCAGAVTLTVNTSCVNTAGTTNGATESMVGCAGTADDDVWFRFVATNAQQTVTVTPVTTGFDGVFQVFSGTCGAPVSENCTDATFMDQTETTTINGFTPGQTYYIRVYDYYSGFTGNFNICVTGSLSSAPTNDNPCSAIQLPPVTSSCNYLEFTTVGATNTATPGAPSGCVGGSGAMIGGYSAGTLDVWFAITVPSNGIIHISPKPNMPSGRITDGVMVLYSGTCGSLTQIQCSDDNNFPGSNNDGLPFIGATGLTPGSTVYLRYFGYGTSTGTFGLCVTTADNDACSNALYICDINGFSSSTSAAYSPDRPCNMRANAEQNNPPTYTYTPGTDQGGIFGQGGPWGSGTTPNVKIDNNSWIRFTAAATTAVLNVNVSDCFVGSYPSGGIQMQIFSAATACCNFTPVSNFVEASTAFSVTANGLTVGNDYYLMVDGFAGDICNYTISAQSGVQYPDITPAGPICTGQTVNLMGPPGATSYEWSFNGATTQNTTATPATTQTYFLEVTGLCGNKQTLTTTVTVYPYPSAPTTTPTITRCTGQTLNLTASTVTGATYSWTGPNSFTSSLQNPSITNVTSVHAGVYSVTVTVNGCTSSSSTTTVTINTTPITPTISSNTPICTGQTLNLFSNTISGVYTWSGPASFSSSLEDPTRTSALTTYSGTYSLFVTANGCNSGTATTNVVVNPTPATPTAGSNSPLCTGQTLNLTSTSVSGATGYTWTGPTNFSVQNPSITNVTTANAGTYTVVATTATCTSAPSSVTVVINTTPTTPVISSNTPVCTGQTINLFSNTYAGSPTYNWTGPSTFTSSLEDPTRANATTAFAGNYVLTVTVNGCTSGSASTAVVVNTTPATPVAGSNSPLCTGQTLNLTSTNTGGTSYSWTGPTNFSVQNPSITNVTTANAGTYTVTTSTATCTSAPASVTVVINTTPATPTISSNTPVCTGQTINLFSNTYAGSPTYTWTGPSSFSSALEDPTRASATTAFGGAYVLTVTVGGCTSASASTTVVVNTTPSTPIAGSNTPLCTGQTLNLTSSTAAGATGYTWTGPTNFSVQNPSITNVTTANAGTYTVVATTATCTSAPSSVAVVIGTTPITPTISSNTPVCTGQTINLFSNTYTGSPTYSWTGPSSFTSALEDPTRASATVAFGGTYTLTVTVGGCTSASATTNVVVNPTPSAPTAGSNTPVCSGNTINLTASTIASATYSWTGPFAGSAVQNPSIPSSTVGNSGTYSVTATVNGCTSIVATTNVVVNPTPVTPAPTNNGPICEGSTLMLSVGAYAGSPTYAWTGPFAGSSLQNPNIPSATTANSGTYTLIVTVGGCPSVAGTTSVTVNAGATTSAGADLASCNGSAVSLLGNIGGAASTSVWSGGTGTYGNINSPTSSYTPSAAEITAGTVTLTITTDNPTGPCNAVSDVMTIAISSSPSANFSYSSATYCQSAIDPNPIFGSGASGGTFSSTAGLVVNSVTGVLDVSASTPGGYSVTNFIPVNGACPSATASTLVTIVATPSTPVVTSNSPVCTGQTITLFSNTFAGSPIYSWTGPDSFTSALEDPTRPGALTTHSGTYSVTVTINGCTSAAGSTNLVINPTPATPTAGSNSPLCTGQTLNLTASTAAGATGYTWTGPTNFSVQNPTITNITTADAGMYTVVATTSTCTSASASVSVTINTTPATPIATSNGTVCQGTPINLSTPTVATGYTWTGPFGGSSVQNPTIPSAALANGGTYTLTVTNASGCTSASATTNVIVNATPATPVPTNNGPICEGSTLALTVSAYAGSPSYNWTGPFGGSTAQNPTIAGALPSNSGTYNLVVTVNGCPSAVGSTSATINPAATVEAGTNLTSCNGAGVSLAGTIGGAATSSTWTGGGGTFGNSSSPTSSYTPSVTETSAGTVTLTLTTDNPTGVCPAVSDIVTIVISNSPSTTFSYTSPTFCQNNSDPSPTFPSGSSPGTFSSTGGLTLNPTSGLITLSTSSAGNYTVTNFIPANGSCPSSTATAPIQIIATPSTPTATGNGNVCDGGTISLSTPTVSGATYNWTGPNLSSTSQNPSITPASFVDDGTYTVTITVNGCTSSTGTTVISIIALPTVSIMNGSMTTICLSNSVLLQATGATTYLWSTTETTSNISVNPATLTTYSVTGTQNGCSASDQIDVAVNTPASMTTTPVAGATNCDTPTGSLTGLVVTGNGGFTYNWMDIFTSTVGSTSDLTNVPAGDYTVEVTDINGCSSVFGPFTVSNAPTPTAPTITASTNSPCLNDSFDVSASSISGATYSWTGPNSFTSSSPNFTIDPATTSNTGSYCVIATVNGCPSSPTCQTVTVNDLPVVSINTAGNDSTGCIGENIVLNATGATSYVWTGPSAYSASTATVTIFGTSLSQSGYYVVTGTNGLNCSATDSILVTINPAPTTTVSSDVNATGSYCLGADAVITATGGGVYNWTGPNGFTNGSPTFLISPLTVDNAGYYVVSVQDPNGCTASDSVLVSIQTNQLGTISGDDVLCPGETLILTTSGGVTYSWAGPNAFNASTATVTIPNLQTSQAGVYSVIIIDSIGCTSFDTTTVEITLSADCLIIPGLVTPDLDGHNDTWDIPGLENYPNASVELFNRWGNLIYSVSPYDKPWAGETNKGLSLDGGDGKVPFGTYFYLIKLNDTEEHEYKGYIELQY